MRWAFAAVVCAVLSLNPVKGSAQDYDKAEVHGGYSYLSIDTNGLTSRQSANGWEAGASGNFNKWFGVEFSGSGYYKNYDIDLTPLGLGTIAVKVRDYSYVAGPRLNYKMVFVHGMVGGDHLSGSASGYSASQDGLAGVFGGGIQQKVAGSWALRVSADYIFSRHNIFGGSSYTQNNYRASAGIAYVFGGGSRNKSVSGSSTSSSAPSGSNVSMPIPELGVSVITTENNKGAEVVNITPGGVADFGGLHRGYIITSVDTKDVHTPMELAAVLSGVTGKVQIGYNFKTSALGWMSNVTTVVIGKQ